MQITLVLKHGLLLLQIIHSKARTGKNERKIFFCTFSSEWGITQHKLVSPLLGKLGINTLSCWNPGGLYSVLHNKALGVNTYRRGKTFQTQAYWGLHTGHSEQFKYQENSALRYGKASFHHFFQQAWDFRWDWLPWQVDRLPDQSKWMVPDSPTDSKLAAYTEFDFTAYQQRKYPQTLLTAKFPSLWRGQCQFWQGGWYFIIK